MRHDAFDTPEPIAPWKIWLIIAAVVAAWGYLGNNDYQEARRAECAAMREPHSYDPGTDKCRPISTYNHR